MQTANRRTTGINHNAIPYLRLTAAGFEMASMQNFIAANSKLLNHPIRTNAFHIFWFKAGGKCFQVNFSPVEFQENTILFVRKDSVQLLHHEKDYHGLSISFTEDFLYQTITDLHFLHDTALFSDHAALTSIQPGERLPAFMAILHAMEEEMEGPPDAFKTDILRNLLRNFLMLAAREKGITSVHHDPMNRDALFTRQYISLVEKEFPRQKKVAAYAAMLHISEKRLHLATTQISGKTPKQLIDEKVLLEARRLLGYSHQLIK
jgi:AraC family transcriptional activator of pobA